jgi:hypothetical protein
MIKLDDSNRRMRGARSLINGTLTGAALLGLWVGSNAHADVWDSAAEADAPIVLSSEHLGMTGDEVQAATTPIEPAAETPELEPEAGMESEWLTNDDIAGADEAPALSEEAEEAGESDACPTVAASPDAVADFQRCIEVSIRGGNGYEESSRVCAAVFPAGTLRAEASVP